ncbi:SGNH/GDSL hydrolase family protein [Demequina flava]|uniref:SGNH/GDSL hydrolase family protein n=1 Tax=Demequina flava TaxID=1095025 RepID=UPI0007839892|nr:GDSL-type esterase/lipase family protein [Demequina flava]
MTAPRVAAIGDSITLGVGDGLKQDWGSVGWASHAAHAWGATEFLCTAFNGARSRDLPAQAARVAQWDPDVVLCSIGGNDALRGDFDADEVRECSESALRTLAAPHRTIVVAQIDRIGLFDVLPRGISTVMAHRAGLVNEALGAAAAASGITILDGATVMARTGKAGWHVDRIHPSPIGHRALATEAIRMLHDTWSPVALVPAAPTPPTRSAQAWWLMRHGTPWALKRSKDLLPALVAVVAAEWVVARRGASQTLPEPERAPALTNDSATAGAGHSS